MIVGKPIHVDKVENPTQEQIDKLHQQYMEGLQKLYDDYKVYIHTLIHSLLQDIFHKNRKQEMRFIR